MSLSWQSAADDDLRRRPADSRRAGKLEPCRTISTPIYMRQLAGVLYNNTQWINRLIWRMRESTKVSDVLWRRSYSKESLNVQHIFK